MQATVIDPADMDGLVSALNKHKVSIGNHYQLSFNLFKAIRLSNNPSLLTAIVLLCRLAFTSQNLRQIHYSDVLTLSWFQSFAMKKVPWFA